jgi:hypothetical protein
MNTLFGKPRFKTGRTRLFILLPAALCGILFLYACDFSGSPLGGESYLTINLSGAPAEASRAVISNDTINNVLEYEVTFTGPGGVPFMEIVPPGSGTFTITLAPGMWSIDVEAYDYPSSVKTLVGTGTAAVTLARGQYKSVPIAMTVDPSYESGLTKIYIHNEAELRRVGSGLPGDFAIDGTITEFVLEDNITITDPWTPIGHATSFDAIFNGAEKTITISNGFSAAALGDQYLGLFGQTGAGTIKNLTIVYNNLTATSTYTSSQYLGGAAAYATGTSFDNVHVKGSINHTASADLDIGGVVGNRSGTADISNCSFEGTLAVTGTSTIYAGGILGNQRTSGGGAIKNSFTAGTISASSGSRIMAGGIVGRGPCSITSCYSAAAVSAASLTGSTNTSMAGGIIGQPVTPSAVKWCYALGPVAITGGAASNNSAGGISGTAGTPSTIQFCAALAEVDGGTTNTYVGRVIGYGSSSSSYAANDTSLARSGSGSNSEDGNTAYALSAFQGSGNQSMYETTLSWTFVNGNWKFIGAYNYPVLSWQTAPPSP